MPRLKYQIIKLRQASLDTIQRANSIIQDAILERRDQDLWDAAVAEEEQARSYLARIADNWDDVIGGLPEAPDADTPDIFDDTE